MKILVIIIAKNFTICQVFLDINNFLPKFSTLLLAVPCCFKIWHTEHHWEMYLKFWSVAGSKMAKFHAVQTRKNYIVWLDASMEFFVFSSLDSLWSKTDKVSDTSLMLYSDRKSPCFMGYLKHGFLSEIVKHYRHPLKLFSNFVRKNAFYLARLHRWD